MTDSPFGLQLGHMLKANQPRFTQIIKAVRYSVRQKQRGLLVGAGWVITVPRQAEFPARGPLRKKKKKGRQAHGDLCRDY